MKVEIENPLVGVMLIMNMSMMIVMLMLMSSCTTLLSEFISAFMCLTYEVHGASTICSYF